MNLKRLFSNPKIKARLSTYRCDVCTPFPCELIEPDVFGPNGSHKPIQPTTCPTHSNKIAKWELQHRGEWLEVGMTKCKVCNHKEPDDISICSKCGHVIELDTEVVDNFLKFLQGKFIPEHFTLQNLPELTPDQAFSIIYILQEWMRLIPDIYEKCSLCHHVYNTESEGCCLDTEDKIEEYNEMGYNFTKADIGKFFCGSCER